jgi:predicted acylesterase/phospholipase RssA
MTAKPIEYCDLVMKGGITSGIVYPNAVLALAKRYRFKNIGGTSAGAIAAAACAAASLGERRKLFAADTVQSEPRETGLEGLAAVAGQLKAKGFIFRLFQPERGAGPAFRSLMAVIAHPGRLRAGGAVLINSVSLAPVATALVLVALLGVAWLVAGVAGIFAALLPILLCTSAASLVFALLRVASLLRRNSFGICTGLNASKSSRPAVPALTNWLDQIIQSLAGQVDRPVLFEDLWKAPRYPDEPGDTALTLEMITTGVSHHEPRKLPFENSTFWFQRDEFLTLFPKDLVSWMADQDRTPLKVAGKLYHRLPAAGRLPILVATRMSLSFPLLLSAVPLYEGVWQSDTSVAPKGAGARKSDEANTLSKTSDALAMGGKQRSQNPTGLRKCWFSDGGIGSNFPIHLFDAALPRWPTFAIDLVYPKTTPDDPEPDVFLPTENNQGWQRRYTDIASDSALREVGAFLFGIVGTMQNWRDLLQSRAPGHRDRIVRIPLTDDEGGLNLNMPQAVIERIAAKGTKAGELIVQKFNFNNHWWVRWRNVASALERFTIGFAKAAGPPLSNSYATAYSSARTGEPRPPSYRFTGPQQEDARRRFDELEHEGLSWEDTDPDLTKGAPKPLPQLRITPTF